MKALTQKKEFLKKAISLLSDSPGTRPLVTKLNGLVRLIDDIESDLEISGESIIELDMDRLEAIEERNRFLNFIDKADDI